MRQATRSAGCLWALLILSATVAVLHAETSGTVAKPLPEGSLAKTDTQVPQPPPAAPAPGYVKSKPKHGAPSKIVKDKTAGGHYYGKNDEDDYGYGGHDDYDHDQYHGGGGYGEHKEGGYGEYKKGGYGGYGKKSYGYQHHLVDDFICDLDASILVVTNSYKNHGYGKGKGGYGKDKKEGYGYEKDKKDSYGGGDDYGKGGDNYGKKDGYGGEDYGKKDSYGEGGYGKKKGYGNHGYSHEEGDYGHHGGYAGHGQDDYDHGSYKKSYGNGGYSNDDYNHHAVAHRLRCSKIAIRNDSDCTTCCQLAARRDRSISKDSIFGFIIDYDQVNYAENSYRKKRSADAHPPAISPSSSGHDSNYKEPEYKDTKKYESGNEGYEHKVDNYEDKGYGQKEDYGHHDNGYGGGDSYDKKDTYGGGSSYGNGANYGYIQRPPTLPFPPYNPRCVCCAPKRHHYNSYKSHHGYGGYKGGYDNHDDYGHGSYGGKKHYGHNHHDSYEHQGYGGQQGEGYGHSGEYGYNRHHEHGYGQEKGYGGGDDYSHEHKEHYGGGRGGGYGYGKKH